MKSSKGQYRRINHDSFKKEEQMFSSHPSISHQDSVCSGVVENQVTALLQHNTIAYRFDLKRC